MKADALSSLRSSLDRLTPFGPGSSARVLSLGIPALDAVLPQQGLPCGSVTELQVRGASGTATSFALWACHAAQQQAFRRGAHTFSTGALRTPNPLPGASQLESAASSVSPWCAFIDPGRTLFAPGVSRLGVDLDHLLVVRPELEAVGRAAIRIAEAQLVSVLVVDLMGTALPLDEHAWQRTVRRLALTVKSAATSILLLTRAEQFRTLSLPTFMRLEFTRRSSESFDLRVAKERTGRISSAHSISCSIFDPNAARRGSVRLLESPRAERRVS